MKSVGKENIRVLFFPRKYRNSEWNPETNKKNLTIIIIITGNIIRVSENSHFFFEQKFSCMRLINKTKKNKQYIRSKLN